MKKKHKYRIKLLRRVGKVFGINPVGSSEKLLSKQDIVNCENSTFIKLIWRIWQLIKNSFIFKLGSWLKIFNGEKVSSWNCISVIWDFCSEWSAFFLSVTLLSRLTQFAGNPQNLTLIHNFILKRAPFFAIWHRFLPKCRSQSFWHLRIDFFTFWF